MKKNIHVDDAQLKRYQRISEMLNRWKNGVVSKKEMMDELGVAQRTIDEDIKRMRELYDAPIANDRNGGYYLTAPFDMPQNLAIHQLDLQALQTAVNTLQDFKGIGIFEHLEGLLQKIKDAVHFKSQTQHHEKLVMFESAPLTVPEDCLSFFWEGILKQKVIQFEYQKFAEDLPTTRIISSHFLREHKNRWYLVCTDHKDNVLKIFGLERTKNYKYLPTPLYINLPAHINPEKIFAQSFGIFLNLKDNTEEVILRFNPLRAKYLKTQPFHPQQLESKRILADSNTEGLTVKFDLIVNDELVMELARLGADVKVIAPDSLQRKIKEYHQKAFSIYEV